MTSSRFSDVAISLAQSSGEQLPCQPAVEIKSTTSSQGRALVVVVPHSPRIDRLELMGDEANANQVVVGGGEHAGREVEDRRRRRQRQ